MVIVGMTIVFMGFSSSNEHNCGAPSCSWLVVWNMFFFPYIGCLIIQLTNSYFSEGCPTTNQVDMDWGVLPAAFFGDSRRLKPSASNTWTTTSLQPEWISCRGGLVRWKMEIWLGNPPKNGKRWGNSSNGAIIQKYGTIVQNMGKSSKNLRKSSKNRRHIPKNMRLMDFGRSPIWWPEVYGFSQKMWPLEVGNMMKQRMEWGAPECR